MHSRNFDGTDLPPRHNWTLLFPFPAPQVREEPVDEYDKPMLQAIGNPQLQDAYRATLKGFYGALKSMDLEYNNICGMTEKELLSNFDGYIERLASNNDMTKVSPNI